jgi:signal transduction histidine kinase
MKLLPILFVVGAISIGAISCKNLAKPGSGSDAGRLQVIKDSIKIMDSLVMITKYNNRTEALHLARRAIVLANESQDSSCCITAYNMMGNAFILSAFDSSWLYYSKAQRMAENNGIIGQYPQVIYNIAYLHHRAFDYKTALSLLDSVVRVSTSLGKWKLLAGTYNFIGGIKADVGMFNDAMDSYRMAADLSREKNIPDHVGLALAGQARITANPAEAFPLYKEAIQKLSDAGGMEHSLAGILNNRGYLERNPDSAIVFYNKAIRISTDLGFTDILIATFNNLTYSYLEKGDVNTAEMLIKEKALPLAQADTNLSDLATLYDTYADISIIQKKYKQAVEFQKLAMSYSVQAEQKIAGDQTRLLSSLLEAKNKELLIRNQKMEISLQAGRNEQYRAWLTLALLFMIGLALTFVWYRQRTRYKMQKERLLSAQRIINAGESEKKQIGRELHDISTHLSMGLQKGVDDSAFLNEQDREKLLEEIESVRTTIRGLSHRMHADLLTSPGLQALLTKLCAEIGNKGEIRLDASVGPGLPGLETQVVLHSYRIVQELLTNAVHHAPGSEVELEIYCQGSLYINYHDTGPGFDTSKTGNTMGIMNIKDRLTLLGGAWSLSSAPGAGTSWEIVIPVTLPAHQTPLQP